MTLSLPPSTLDALVTAVQRGVEGRFPRNRREPEARVKDDGSLVTAVDTALQRSLGRSLAAGWPGIPVLGEESTATEASAILEGVQGKREGGRDGGSAPASFWCLDPLDGTSNFVAGFPAFGVSVALVDEEGPCLGVVHDLARGETFAAARGHGAWLDGRPMTPGDHLPRRLGDAMALVDLKRLPAPLAARVATEHPFRSQRNIGSSALEWCWLAAGRCHLYLHGSQRPWDYAAGMLILAEAGGSFVLDPEPMGSAGFDLDARAVIAAGSPPLLAAWRDWILDTDRQDPGGPAAPPSS
jgi:myo-inositol-1(or 4)-monophosphatase